MLEGKKRVQDNSIEASETKVATIHYYWLDIIRFLAAFSVLLCHGRGFFLPAYGDLPAMQQTPLTFCFYFLTRFGHEAVIVFFVLSGFLVGGRGITRMISGKFDITSYAIDRFVRILLPLFGALLFHLVASIIYGADVNPLEFIGNLFSLQGVFVSSVVEPLWSLSYEVWFYIMLGAIACFVLQRNRVCRYGALFVLLICSYIFYKLQAIYLFIWVLGALGYFLVPSKPNYRLLWLFASFAILSLMLCQIAFTSRAFPWIPEISLFVMLLLFATFCILWMVQQVTVVPRKKVTLV
ncbi:MAG: acyltransferase family protein, partial [Kiritimatiellia bacterium]